MAGLRNYFIHLIYSYFFSPNAVKLTVDNLIVFKNIFKITFNLNNFSN